jgi:micrococcal nuclease
VNSLPYEYDASLVRVVDGDTVVLKIDLGFKVETEQSCRLYGIDTPELIGETRAAGLAAKVFVEMSLAAATGKLRVKTHKPIRDKYGRYLVELLYPVGDTDINLNEQLVTFGYAKLATY